MAIGNSDGSIVLKTKIDDSGIKSGMKKMSLDTSKQLFSLTKQYASLAKQGKGASEEAQNVAKQISELGGVSIGAGAALGGVGIAIGAVIAVATVAISVIADLTRKLIDFSKEASEVATQTESSIYRLTSIYGEASDVVGDFIDANSMVLGMSKSAAASFAAVYGNLFGVWADSATNANLTNEYLRMTAVLASQTGRTVEDVQERIRSGLLGNTEAIEDLGIFVNVKTIEMTDAFKRMANGKSWQQLDAYTQQQIRSMAILEQATAKYGDQVADTSVLAKSQLSAAWQDFQSTWGTAVNTVLIPMLNVVTRIIQVATIGLQTLLGSSGKILENAGETLNKQEGITEETKDTEKAQKGVLAGFDKINILNASDEADTGISGTGASIPLSFTLTGADEVVGGLGEFRSECERILAPLSESFEGLFDKLIFAYDKVKEEVFIPFSEWFTTEFTPELISEFATQIDEMALSVGTLTEKMDSLSGTTVFTFLKDLVTLVSGFVMPILDFVNNLISDITRNSNELAIVLGLLWGILYPFVSTLWVSVWSLLGNILTFIIELIAAIGSLGAIIVEFFAMLFSFDSEKMEGHFNRLIASFGNFMISLLNMFIALMNAVVSIVWGTIGTLINTIGGLIEQVAKIAGITIDIDHLFGPTVPQIPYMDKMEIPALAQGAVIPPNREFLAVLGDQKHGTNIETPLATMIEAFQMALDSRGGYNGGGNTEVILEIEGREFGRAVVEQGNREKRRIGTKLVIA